VVCAAKPRLRYCPMTSSSRFPLIAVPGWSETGGDVFQLQE